MTFNFSKEEMQEMEDLINTFIETMNLELDVPVDIFKVATILGFDVRGAEFEDQIEGLLAVNEFLDVIDGFDSNKIIAYDCSKDIDTKKFIVAHELAHYLSEKISANDKKIILAAREHEESYSSNKEEQSMDYIAASLLVPKNDLIEFIKTNANVTSVQVAERYKVSLELAKRRIEEVQA